MDGVVNLVHESEARRDSEKGSERRMSRQPVVDCTEYDTRKDQGGNRIEGVRSIQTEGASAAAEGFKLDRKRQVKLEIQNQLIKDVICDHERFI